MNISAVRMMNPRNPSMRCNVAPPVAAIDTSGIATADSGAPFERVRPELFGPIVPRRMPSSIRYQMPTMISAMLRIQSTAVGL